jgi:formylglycine-generating enzyme required for sulfatase activity/tRNA A-37 threonylcarbamoyl transferase component Bud32
MWQANQTIKDDRFLIQAILGGGGFGVAYRAEDRKERRQVVIKTLNQRQQNQADFAEQQEKFMNEAMRLKGFAHPHIVEVYELIQVDGLLGMVMEYIDGQELAEYVEDKGKLTESQALKYIEQVGEALIYIHEKGFLHRDIKPHNIMLRAGSQQAVLIDFGLARGYIDGKTLSMTNSHTPAYAPIEQYDRHGHFGAHTDIYALAATLYHLITGEPPIFPAKGRLEAQNKGQSIDRFLWDKIPEGITERTKQGIIQGMAVLPKDRPQTMVDLFQILGLGVQPVIIAPPPPPVIPVVKPSATGSIVPVKVPQKRPVTPPPTPKQEVRATPRYTPAETPAPSKTPPSHPATRRNFIKWLGFGGVGAVSVLAFSQISKKSPDAPTLPSASSPSVAGSAVKLTEIQFTSVKLNDKAVIIAKPPGTAQIYTEALDNSVGLNIVKIPGGKFMMGSPKSEKNRQDRESPQHEVTVAEFYLGQTLVTQAQYQAIMGNNPSEFKGNDKLPVENVTWLDAVAFCEKLSQKTNRTYRLPSEAEWEYACRAGTNTPYGFGETINLSVANYGVDFFGGEVAGEEYRKKTTPVGSFPPNLFGLYDMHGNLEEWCLDELTNNYNGAPTDGSARGDIVSRADHTSRLKRGGSWKLGAQDCRSAYRGDYIASVRFDYVGFRVVGVQPRSS